MTTLTPEDRARLRDLAHRMLETPVRGAASTALAEGVTALLDTLDAETSRADRAEAAVQRVREMHVPQPHGPGQCDPDGCPDLCQECGERMPCTTRRIICERTTLGADDWEADPAQVARYYSDKRPQRVQRTLDGDA